MKVNPRSVGGAKKVNEAVRLAYNCAVNLLRQRRYFRAALVPHTNTAILPAIYAQTVLDKINGVLDPDDRVNGAVEFTSGVISAPVHAGGRLPFEGVYMSEEGTTGTLDNLDGTSNSSPAAGSYSKLAVKRANNTSAANPQPGATLPPLSANLTGLNVGTLSLLDFYNAETMDRFARFMDQMMRDNPQYGEEMVLRWAHGLSVDAGRNPFILAERSVVMNKSLAGAMDTDGINDDVMRTDGSVRLGITVPVPRTELGGIIITLISLKPDEKLASQPEPFLSDVWDADNFVADSLSCRS